MILSMRASIWIISPYLCPGQTGMGAIMALYEFRLLDAGGRQTATRMFECATIQKAIGVSMKFSDSYQFVEVWLEGKAVMRMPEG